MHFIDNIPLQATSQANFSTPLHMVNSNFIKKQQLLLMIYQKKRA